MMVSVRGMDAEQIIVAGVQSSLSATLLRNHTRCEPFALLGIKQQAVLDLMGRKVHFSVPHHRHNRVELRAVLLHQCAGVSVCRKASGAVKDSIQLALGAQPLGHFFLGCFPRGFSQSLKGPEPHRGGESQYRGVQ